METEERTAVDKTDSPSTGTADQLRHLEASIEKLRAANHELSILNSISIKVGAAMDLSEAAYLLKQQLILELSVTRGCIFIWDLNRESYSLHEHWGITSAEAAFLRNLKADDLPCFSRDPGRIPNVSSIPDENRHCGDKCPFSTRSSADSCVFVPLVAKGSPQGLLMIVGEHRLDDELVGFFKAFGFQIGIAFERTRLFEQIAAARERSEQLSNSIVQIQEAERQNIARELHDEIGSALTGLKLILELGLRAPEKDYQDTLSEARELVADLMARVRQISLDLRPGMLDDLGVVPALVWFFERFTSQTRVAVRFLHSGLEGERFSQAVETAIYRIIQEALTNAARHAEVTIVNVHVWKDADIVYLEIGDEGKGFDLRPVLKANRSSGLAGMGERARLLGGGLTIESEPGRGTRITANLPV